MNLLIVILYFTFQNFVQIVNDILFDHTLTISDCFKMRLLLMSFFVPILEEKINEEIQKRIMKFLTVNIVSNHICFAILIHENLYKKYFLKSLQSYQKNIIYKSPFKPSLNKKINNKNLIANNYSNNNKFSNNNEKQKILFRSYEKEQKEIFINDGDKTKIR